MYNKNYQTGFSVKRVVRSFRDLEVYQKTLACSVLVVKDIIPSLQKLKFPFVVGMTDCSMSIPLYIAEGHSIRFGDHKRGLALLELAMAGCNKMIVYLEQSQGIYRPSAEVALPSGRRSRLPALDHELVDDLIRRYAEVRTKIFRLEKSWEKWYEPKK